MSVYDTRFFFEYFYSSKKLVLEKTKAKLRKEKDRFISSISIHEVYKLTLEREGLEIAELRASVLEKDFKVVEVDSEIAKLSARIRHRYRIPMADSIIAATAVKLNLPCITDDEHISRVKEIRTRWV
ncbi:MAG TPA: type II toxin-antitoxin system VapC family toxin [Candidatus Korarchaeota archaeon]|nr:type II toxin-antitoxin system VapC family toxin [Candidatus Korarchaeota archaeon]